MYFLAMALLAVYAVFAMVTIQADVHRFERTQLRLQVNAAGFHKTWHISGLPGAAAQFRQSRGSLLLETLLRADKARKFLLRHIRLDRLDGLVLLRTADAARSALLLGTLQGVLCCIPQIRRRNVHIRVLPDFFREHSTVRARCIIRVRLGTIILTAGMLLLAYLREQRLTESEAM